METNNIMLSYGLTPLPKNPVETMAYVPFQPNAPEMCKPPLALENGTIFKSLTKPFCGKKCTGGKE